jgi:RNA binding activity-knot of a chromodomain/Agenet domain
MATAALANKVGEKIGFLSFLSNITPKADVTQTIDLVLKIAVEIIAFSKLNGLPSPNPQAFATTLSENYKDASLTRMIALVCLDGLLPLGPDFLSKIHTIITGTDVSVVAQNPVFLGVNSFLPGNNPTEKFGFITQAFNAVQGWMNGLVAKTGLTPQSISSHLGSFIQIADDNLDFVAAFLDQTTNYYEHTGIQTVARTLILRSHALVKAELPQDSPQPHRDTSSAAKPATGEYAVSKTIEVWDEDEEDWYQATIEKVENDKFFVNYLGYGSSYNEWVGEDEIRVREHSSTDSNGFAVKQKVKVWDEDEEDWYSANIEKIQGQQYYVHYLEYDSSYDEWVDLEEIR